MERHIERRLRIVGAQLRHIERLDQAESGAQEHLAAVRQSMLSNGVFGPTKIASMPGSPKMLSASLTDLMCSH